MKRIHTTFLCLFIAATTFAQPSAVSNRSGDAKIKLSNGQRISIENTTAIQATLTMGMELTSNSATTNSLEVKNVAPGNYTIGSTLTKVKADMNMMGQAGSYDSENKQGNSEQMAKAFDDRLNKQVDITIDSKTGAAIANNSKDKPGENAASDPVENIMKMFSDFSDEGVVTGAFEIIPAGKGVGDSWSDSTTDKDSKTVHTYTLKSLSGNEAVIQTASVSTAKGKLNFQEMEFDVSSETKTTGEIITDISNGLVKKRTSVADVNGNIQIMGQEMPISAKSTSTTIYK